MHNPSSISHSHQLSFTLQQLSLFSKLCLLTMSFFPAVFAPYKDSKVDLLAPKLLFIALNLGGLALGVWKLNTLGLLPTHASDWVSSLPPAQVQSLNPLACTMS
ncbi:hypothetical protein RHGRI_020895 [Rhododendron griersonianum]|uniref:ER membrane protein complex subunit 4 n=1 Tax=Rhododendron griersonianum TaxID=479676 RepID=A0AAV6JQH1_9ERIC|nr:hypothetical protein RHGRI_020895 [Rhododendron griersonianum]